MTFGPSEFRYYARLVADGEVICTAIDNDWGDERPNMLMHPPCACPRCAPAPSEPAPERNWLQVSGQRQRRRVAPAELGDAGRSALG